MLKTAWESIKAMAAKLNLREMLLAGAKLQAIKIVQEEGDKQQEALKKAIAEKGPDAIDAVFNASQAALIARIQAL